MFFSYLVDIFDNVNRDPTELIAIGRRVKPEFVQVLTFDVDVIAWAEFVTVAAGYVSSAIVTDINFAGIGGQCPNVETFIFSR
jgi:hypothetical protein